MENIISMTNLPAVIRAAMDIQINRIDGYPLLILGPVGVGKSQVPVQVAREEGWEVIRQKSHQACYDHQITACGVRLVEVETVAELYRSIHKKTVHPLTLTLTPLRKLDFF